MSDRRIKDALLERYLAGELSAPARAELDATLQASEADRARLQELEIDSRAFLIQHPPGRLVARFEREHSRTRFRAMLAFVVGTAMAATAAVFVVVARPESDRGIKGNVSLALYRKSAAGAERLAPGEMVSAGDSLRFEVRAPSAGWVAILSQDGAGNVSVYHPFGADQPGPYDPGQPLLASAVQLDASPGPETLYVLFSPSHFDVRPFLNALRERRALPTVANVTAERVELPKR